jgi:hypothetical protein
MDLAIPKISSMWQTTDGHVYYLSSNVDMITAPRKIETEQPIGYRRLTDKPCSDCGIPGKCANARGITYALFKGRKDDWLCSNCAKSQNII